MSKEFSSPNVSKTSLLFPILMVRLHCLKIQLRSLSSPKSPGSVITSPSDATSSSSKFSTVSNSSATVRDLHLK